MPMMSQACGLRLTGNGGVDVLGEELPESEFLDDSGSLPELSDSGINLENMLNQTEPQVEANESNPLNSSAQTFSANNPCCSKSTNVNRSQIHPADLVRTRPSRKRKYRPAPSRMRKALFYPHF